MLAHSFHFAGIVLKSISHSYQWLCLVMAVMSWTRLIWELLGKFHIRILSINYSDYFGTQKSK